MVTKNLWKYSKGIGSKYHNQKCELDGMKFDSKKEMERYIELKLLQRAGEIRDLRCQVPFVLIEKSKYGRAIKYIADFTYYEGCQLVVEDTKSPATITPVYKLKKRLMAEYYNIEIREI